MNLSYHLVVSWIKQNWKVLVISECICLTLVGVYLVIAPRIYETNFSVRLPKMQVANTNNPSRLEWKLMISGLDFMRGMQNPLTFSNDLIQKCFGEDSNANRRKFINSMQLGLQNHGDIVLFSLRIDGRENVIRCANLLQERILSDLSDIYDVQIQKNQSSSSAAIPIFEKAAVVNSLRVSDSFIKPQIDKSIYAALFAGLFLAIFAVSLKAKYRA
jgi:hypothetical protein